MAIDPEKNPVTHALSIAFGEYDRLIDLLVADRKRLYLALKALRIDANRLCDRNLGGTYESDCRRAIATADEVMRRSRETFVPADLRVTAADDGRAHLEPEIQQ